MSNISPHTYTPFRPELVDPSQFHAAPARRGEKKLLLAVLEEALACLSERPVGVQTPTAKRTCVKQAQSWVASNDTSHLYTFLRICEALDLEPHWIRSGIQRQGFKLPHGLRTDRGAVGIAPRPTVERRRTA